MTSLTCFHQISSQITIIRHKPSKTTHPISQSPIPTKIYVRRSLPKPEMWSPTMERCALRFRKWLPFAIWSRNDMQRLELWWSFNGEEEERNSNVRKRGRKASEFFWGWVRRERERGLCLKGFLFSFFFFLTKRCATCLLLSGAKRVHFFFLDVTHNQSQEEKNLTFLKR